LGSPGTGSGFRYTRRERLKADHYEQAKKRVEEKMDFFSHLAVYIIVNVVLIVINLTQSPGYLWFYWALLGWGIGLFFHGMATFVWGEGSSLRQRMIRKEMERCERDEDLKPPPE
jgi:hypothetical protein